MRVVLAAVAAVGLVAGAARAQVFDYYVLAVSWLPAWCAQDGSARADPRCEGRAAGGWGLHGLWPQFEVGWPEYCRSPHPDPTRAETAAAAAVFGTAGSAWHQWRKHGRCSGLAARDYFRAAARALGAVRLPPDPGARGDRPTAAEIGRAVRALNPGIGGDMLAVTCRGGALAEVRLCLTPDFRPRACGRDVLARDCGSRPLALFR
jgi:ribonuclease T2